MRFIRLLWMLIEIRYLAHSSYSVNSYELNEAFTCAKGLLSGT